MKAYHWCSTANNFAFHKAKKYLEAAVRMDPIKAWKAMRTLEKGLKHHHSPCHTIQMEKPNGSKVPTDEENTK
eukprot:12742385-Ditylum_brightwellii.AAC.1